MQNDRISIQSLERRVADHFSKAGIPAETSKAVATALVMAEAEGQQGHGLSRIPSYLAQFASEKINPQAEPKLDTPQPSVLLVDADNGFAYPALEKAFEKARDIARSQGVCMVLVSKSHHCGSLGYQVEKYAEAGQIALMMANTPVAMAMYGGTQPKLGTNPMAFAAPVQGGRPLVIDLALSQVARGKIVVAAKEGKPIPEGWAIDADGRPTTDANEALKGSLLPAGGAKGSALALMVEVMAAALTGACFSARAASFLDTGGGAPNVGQFILVIDPSGSVPGFPERMKELVEIVTGDEAVRLPGTRRSHCLEEAVTNGFDASIFEKHGL